MGVWTRVVIGHVVRAVSAGSRKHQVKLTDSQDKFNERVLVFLRLPAAGNEGMGNLSTICGLISSSLLCLATNLKASSPDGTVTVL